MSATLPGLESLRDKVVIVTGGSRGQGAVEAELFVSLGAHVVIADVLDDDGKVLADRLGERATYHHLDVTDEDAWAALVAEVIGSHGHVDVLVNNAAILAKGALADWSVADLRRLVDIDLVGAILGLRAVSPHLREGGAVINIASTAAVAGYAASLPYSAAKWGLRGVTRSAARELGPRGVRVVCVCPGGVDTEMIDAAAVDWSHAPVPRPGTPGEIANVVVFLASDAASFVTGTEVVVDGGANA